jgi:biopolymer transport protein ExbD
MAVSDGLRGETLRHIFPHRKRKIALRMAPLIDVIFLLLIFFLVAGKWQPKQLQLPFNLPAAVGGISQLGKAEPLVIELSDSNGNCVAYFAGKQTQLQAGQLQLSLEQMLDELKETLQSQKRNTGDTVEIFCGEDVQWRYFARVYNILYSAGFEDITFTAETKQQYNQTKNLNH